MRKGWTETTVGEIAELICRGKAPSYCEEDGVAVVNQKCIRNGRIYFEFARMTDSSKKSIPDWAFLRIGDTLINSTGVGTLGRASLVSRLEEKTTFDSHVTLVRPNPNLCFPAYVGLFLNFREREIEMFGGGSTGQTELSREAVNAFPITFPPLAEQMRIVDAVSSVDAYVDALQQNADFVRNLFNGVCQEVFSANADLKKLSDIASVIMGQSPEGSTCNALGIGTPLLTGPTEFKRYVVGPPRQWTQKETKISNSGDILFCVRGATAGRINIAAYKSVIGRGLAAIRCSNESDTNFVRYSLMTGLSKLLPNSSGTIFPNISQSQLKEFQVFWPDEVNRRNHSELIRSIEDDVYATEQAVAKAKALRAGLMTDLLSGNHEIPASYDSLIRAA